MNNTLKVINSKNMKKKFIYYSLSQFFIFDFLYY